MKVLKVIVRKCHGYIPTKRQAHIDEQVLHFGGRNKCGKLGNPWHSFRPLNGRIHNQKTGLGAHSPMGSDFTAGGGRPSKQDLHEDARFVLGIGGVCLGDMSARLDGGLMTIAEAAMESDSKRALDWREVAVIEVFDHIFRLHALDDGLLHGVVSVRIVLVVSVDRVLELILCDIVKH